MEYRLYKGTGFGSNENYKLNTDQCDLYLRTMPADSYITITDNKPFNSGAFRTGQVEILIKQSDILGIDSFLSLASFDYLRVLLPTVTTNPPTKAYFYYFIDNIDLIAVKGGEIGEYILKLTIRLDYFNTYKLDNLLLNMDVAQSQLLISTGENKVNSLLPAPVPVSLPTVLQAVVPAKEYLWAFLLLVQTNLIGPILLLVPATSTTPRVNAQTLISSPEIFKRITYLGQASKLRIHNVSGDLNITSIKLWVIPNIIGLSGAGAQLSVYGENILCTMVESTASVNVKLEPLDYSLNNSDNFKGSDPRYAYGTYRKYILPPDNEYYSGANKKPIINYSITPQGLIVTLTAWDKSIDISDEFEIFVSKSSDTDFWNTQALSTGIKLVTGTGQVVAGAATGSVISAAIGVGSLASTVAQIASGSPATAVNIGQSNAYINLYKCKNLVGAFSLGPQLKSEIEKAYGIIFPTPYHLGENIKLSDLQVAYPTITNIGAKRTWYIRATSVSVAQHDKVAGGADKFHSVPTEAIKYLKERLYEGMNYFFSYIDFKEKSLIY